MCPSAKSVLKSIRKLISKINYVGVIAFELFDTGKDIIINEVAPRVHNSAHYSMDALHCDQFEYHIRAICGQPLPQVKLCAPAFAMVNLLGKKNNLPSLQLSNEAKMHWYGKSQNRKGRKMGHINLLGSSRIKILKDVLKISKEVKI